MTNKLRAMASLCPRSSAPIPGYAPGVSISVISGKPNFSARCMSRKTLAITLGPRHAVVAPHALFGVATFLMADDDDRLVVEPRQAADEGMVVGVHAIAVQLLKIGEALVDIVERVRPLRVTRELSDLPCRQVREDAARQRFALVPRREISSLMLSSESSPTNLRASMRASSSAIGCSNSRNFKSIATQATATLAPYPTVIRGDKHRAWRMSVCARCHGGLDGVFRASPGGPMFSRRTHKGRGPEVPSKLATRARSHCHR